MRLLAAKCHAQVYSAAYNFASGTQSCDTLEAGYEILDYLIACAQKDTGTDTLVGKLYNLKGYFFQKDVTFRTFFTPRRLLALAAAFLVLLAAVWFVGKQPQPQALADGYIAQNGPFRFPSNHRGNDQTANWRTRATEAYQSEHYADAAKILETATPSPDSLDGADWFLLGAAYFYGGNNEASIPCFEKAQTKAPQYADDLKWHLALAYLRLGKPDQARPFLTALANDPRSIYASSAHDCLERLGR